MIKLKKYQCCNKAHSINAKYSFEDIAVTDLITYQGSIKNLEQKKSIYK